MKINVNINVKRLRQYRLVADKASRGNDDLPLASNSGELYKLLISEVYDPYEIEVYETFYALFLNNANRVKGYIKVSSGGVDGVIVDPKIIFCAALKCLATGIVITHNHPSGSTRPSDLDRSITKKLSEGAKLLNMRLVDHIIVAPKSYHSFLDCGELNTL